MLVIIPKRDFDDILNGDKKNPRTPKQLDPERK